MSKPAKMPCPESNGSVQVLNGLSGVSERDIQVLLMFLVVLAINLQFWFFDVTPQVDWPNHLARHILHCGALGSENISLYYLYELRLVPNLIADLVYTLPLACRDPELTQKILIQVSSFGVFAGTAVLHRSIWGAWSVWPALAGLLMHHMAWAYGFENFVVTAPLVLLVLAAWFALEQSGVVLRLGVIWPLATAIFISHLYAFGFLMMAIGMLEFQRFLDRFGKPGAFRSALVAAAMLGLIAMWPALQTLSALELSTEIGSRSLRHGGFSTFLMTILSPTAGMGHVLASNEAIQAAAAGLAVLLAAPLICRLFGLTVQFDRRLRLVAPLMVVVALLVPQNLFDVAFTNVRFPVLTAAVLIAATRVEFTARSGRIFLVVVLAAVAVKAQWVVGTWREHEVQIAELREAGGLLTERDRLIVLREGMDETIIDHSHSASYLLRDNGAYWWGLFTIGNSLAPREEFAKMDHPQPFPLPWELLEPGREDDLEAFGGDRLSLWQQFYTHALVLFDPGRTSSDFGTIGTTVHRGSFFEILRLDTAGSPPDR